MEDFSLIILCRSKQHLLSMTLDTLKSQQGAFEVIILEAEAPGHLVHIAKNYPELNIRWGNTGSAALSQMMNEGVNLAQGKYIQFLTPGDRYISQHGIQFLTKQIENRPPLIITQGTVPNATVPWFSREKVLELGGFDERLLFCPLQDLLYRFQNRGLLPLIHRRVIVDSQIEPLGSIREMCHILYRHLGLKQMLKWMFVQDYPQVWQRVKAFLKGSFLYPNDY